MKLILTPSSQGVVLPIGALVALVVRWKRNVAPCGAMPGK